MFGRFGAIGRMIVKPRDWRGVHPGWFLRSPSVIDKRFTERSSICVERDGQLQIVLINGQRYIWPGSMPLGPLLQIASEISTPSHPNQYLWGPTGVTKGDVVLDIGACEGSFSARVAELGARAIAIEPSQRMHQVIRQLFQVRGLDAPDIVGCLLGREHRRSWFTDDHQNVGHSRISRPDIDDGQLMDVRTLDDVVEELKLDRCDFIKCDAEGADLDIVMGGQCTLETFHPKLAICTYHAADHYGRLRRHLLDLGYHVRGKGFLNSGERLRVIMLHAWWPGAATE